MNNNKKSITSIKLPKLFIKLKKFTIYRLGLIYMQTIRFL